MKQAGQAKKRIVALILMLITASCLLLSGCGGAKGDAAAVREDLESMRYVELDPDTEAEIENILSDQGKEYFEMFLSKAGEFEYEIIESRKEESGSGTAVTVRIKTYDFASEYLRSWSEFLEKNDSGAADGGTAADDGTQSGYDQAVLYETLFKNLSSAADKSYISETEIHCAESEDGSWHTDAKTNAAVKNAILGGMLNEIASLAGVSY